MPIRRSYGAKRDRPDRRDHLLRRLPISVPPLSSLPPATQNRQFVWNIKDQGAEGSCTGHRTASQWEWNRNRFLGDKTLLSAQFVYDIERELEGTPLTEDSGADPRDGCRCITRFGACPESLLPYGPANFSTAPTPEQLAAALTLKGGGYHRLFDVADIMYCMAELPGFPGFPTGFAFLVPDYFESQQVADTGMVPMPPTDPSKLNIVGGHDTLALDYDLTVHCPGAPNPGAVLCQNSWGEWGFTDPITGLRGFFWVPFDAIPILVTDMWLLHFGAPWPPSPPAPKLMPGLVLA